MFCFDFKDRLYLGTNNNHPMRVASPTLPSTIPDMTTIPVYRNGRKFYVTAEEYERIKASERKQRRTVVQKSNNLPVQKSYSTNHMRSRAGGGGVDHHHPRVGLQRVVSHATNGTSDNTYGFSTNKGNSTTILSPTTMKRTITPSTLLTPSSMSRQSRSTSRNDEQKPYSPSNGRSNSSDKILANRSRISSPSRTSFDDDSKANVSRAFSPRSQTYAYNRSDKPQKYQMTPNNINSNNRLTNYFPHDFNQHSQNSENNQYQENSDPHHDDILKRSISPELLTPIPHQYGIAPINTFSIVPLDKRSIITDQIYMPTNSKSLNTNQLPKGFVSRNFDIELESNRKSTLPISSAMGSMYQTGIRGVDHSYSIFGQSNQFDDEPSPNHNFNINRQGITGFLNDRFISYSDDNSSIIKRDDDNHKQVAYLSNDDERPASRGRGMESRSTVRSHSSDGLTEKKRVRFADTVGLNLETVDRVSRRDSGASSDGEQQSYKPNFKQQHQQQQQQHYTRLLSRRPHVTMNDRTKASQIQHSTNNNFQKYKISKNNAGSLVTDV
ncbi:unnamed protein product [Didymodactylos carnosus]|uniref:Uncharacterized protein n=1 Tax=Didymodactylos carnosus TaxID=1234261 RepID=A0A813QMB8_9BILA|nr:unnamed protein product [Didymodactylos carnosus]CAF0942099.1 unnamed protein product [Didymodactylos carnosus]CAF3550958.1 unnamed protein product [Didymodactylos carnosus]CAF3717058.1 unnamed protein product [Didymodactylos carnosus]